MNIFSQLDELLLYPVHAVSPYLEIAATAISSFSLELEEKNSDIWCIFFYIEAIFTNFEV